MNHAPSGADGLFAYLQKQREARRIAAEIEELESDNIVRQSLKVKHELEALMADYDLSAKELIETACLMFGFEHLINTDNTAHAENGKSGMDATSSAKSSGYSGAEMVTKPSDTQGVSSGAAGQFSQPNKKAAVSSSKRVGRPKSGGASSQSARLSVNGEKATEKKQSGARVVRRGRKAMVYENPHTGQKVVTKGSNHRTLNEWREQYGESEVASWGRQQQADS